MISSDPAHTPPRHGLRAVPVDDELVIVDQFGGRTYALDVIASFVWECSVEGDTVSTIAEELSPHFNTSHERIVADVTALKSNLTELGLLGRAEPALPLAEDDECNVGPEELTVAEQRHGLKIPQFDDRYLAAPPNF